MKYNHFFLAFALLVNQFCSYAATRTWSGAGTGTVAWAGNWGTDPVAGDDIEITTTGTLIITGMPALALNSITIHGGSNYTVEFQGANTLTVGGNAGTDFVIDASTGFKLSATNAPSITMAANATSTINGVFTINAGCTFTMSNANVVNTISTTGSIVNAGTITGASTSKLIFEGSSSYNHTGDGGTIPTADWNGATNTGTSTCTVSGMINTKPSGLTTASNTFYHFTWNCPGQMTGLIDGQQGSICGSGENFTCLGNFTIANSFAEVIAFSDVSGGALSTMTVGGNMVLSSAYDNFIINYWSTPVTVDISGDLIVSGGHLDVKQTTTGAVTTVNVSGNVTVSSGDLHVNIDGYNGGVTLNVTGSLTVSGGDFVGTYGAGTANINITSNVSVSSGNFYGTLSSGSPAFVVGGNFSVSGTGVFVGSESSGAPTFSITGNVSVSAGDILFARSTGAPTMTITGDLNVSGTGRWYGQDLSTGSPTINVTGNLNVSNGEFYGTNFGAGSPTYNITGNVAISGSGDFYGSGYSAGSGDPTYNVTGTFTVSGGSTTFYGSGASGGNPTFNIQGSVDLSTGTVGACNFYTSNTSTCTFNLTGASSNNLTLKTGLTYDAGAPWSWNISAGRTITLLSNIEIGGTASACIFTNNGTLIMGTYTFPAVTTAAASFVNASGATLKTAHLSGLSTTAATGAIQVTGTKTFSSAASYVFNGAAAQVTGNFGASTTPTASTVANLEFNNTSGVTLTEGLTVADAGTLTLTTGYHNLATYTLQLGTSAANTLAYTAGGLYSSTDNGSFKRWIPTGAVTSTSGNYYGLFPFKKSASKLNVLELNSTANVTTAGFITATAGFATTVTDVVDFADDNGTVQALKSGKGITLALTTIAGGTFGIKVTSGNFPGGTLSDYTLVTYTGGSTGYQTTFAATTGTTTNPIVARTGVSLANLAQTWVVGTYNFGATTLPIELVSFAGTKDGNNNILFWTTETELNNDFFTIEKTINGEVYEVVGTMDGAGNSNQLLEYSLKDDDVRQVLNYYRLKQTDFDGKFTYSNTITIDNRSGVSKDVSMVTNILGQEVNEYYRGVVIIVYTDGTSIKVIQ